MKNFLIKTLASGFGSGYAPLASGTVATLVAAVIAWGLFTGTAVAVAVTAATLLLAVPVSTAAEKLYGKKDDSRITIDEFAGFFVAVLLVPRTFPAYAAAIVAFRFFDVVKPWFVSRVQSLPAGWGIVADDVLAGLLANLVVQAIILVM